MKGKEMSEEKKEKVTRHDLRVARRKVKLAGVAQRQAERAKRSDSQQIARLDKMFGKNKGAVKERARLTQKKES